MKSYLFRTCSIVVLSLVVLAGNVWAAGPVRGVAFGKSTPQEILDAALAKINQYDTDGTDVPDDVYAFFFRAEALLHPEYYSERNPNSQALDQFLDVCPGGTITVPDWEDSDDDEYHITSCGQTFNATNNCTYPTCRLGRDVVVTLEIQNYTGALIYTRGSMFDTYLCLYAESCCGSTDDLFSWNNNAPWMNNGQPLAAGLIECLEPGTYYLILDGASVAARGSYCVHFDFYQDCDG